MKKRQNMLFLKVVLGALLKNVCCSDAHVLDFEVKSADEFAKFTFDDPRDDRRYFDKRCDIINCGDSFGTIESYVKL